MKKYHYFVSYYVPSIGVCGNYDITASAKISSYDDIVAMKKVLAEVNHMNISSPDEIMFYGLPQLIQDEPY